ncbi:uncharacterized protein NPIL_185101 [Nephila pilipes]|uniref:Uncharacterized protein n=1 Tax=Nephila pilipes TaxID=299642 RepID=A0A8X6UDH7_NEPPI|nr:uncharacterized protein NPIL_185101 [Nephila pilipes]
MPKETTRGRCGKIRPASTQKLAISVFRDKEGREKKNGPKGQYTHWSFSEMRSLSCPAGLGAPGADNLINGSPIVAPPRSDKSVCNGNWIWILLDKSRRTEHEMDQFRPQQHGTRLRPGPREPEDRSYSGAVAVEARTTRPEDANVYESFDERRRSYDEPYHRSRGKIAVSVSQLMATVLTLQISTKFNPKYIVIGSNIENSDIWFSQTFQQNI